MSCVLTHVQVSKEFFDVLLKSYQEDHRLYKCTNIEQTDYVFDEPSRFRISEVKQEGGGVKLVGVKKEKLDHHNIRAMPRLQYDVRIGASREVEYVLRCSWGRKCVALYLCPCALGVGYCIVHCTPVQQFTRAQSGSTFNCTGWMERTQEEEEILLPRA